MLVPVSVLVETAQVLERRAGSKVEARFLQDFAKSGLTLVDLNGDDLGRMSALVDHYANLPLGSVDASVIAVAERLNIHAVATLDRRHFTVVRPCHVDAFDLLPAEL